MAMVLALSWIEPAMPFLDLSHVAAVSGVVCVAAGVAFSAAPAKAMFDIRIFEEGPNLMVSFRGSASFLPSPVVAASFCDPDGQLVGETFPSSFRGVICTGQDGIVNLYPITGPLGYGGNSTISTNVVSGPSMVFISPSYSDIPFIESTIGIFSSYILGDEIESNATFFNQTLEENGFTDRGLVGTWSY